METLLANRLHRSAEDIRMNLYGPQAQLYLHAIAFSSGAATVSPDRPARAQVANLNAIDADSDPLLSL